MKSSQASAVRVPGVGLVADDPCVGSHGEYERTEEADVRPRDPR
jgi:hypothetical protein